MISEREGSVESFPADMKVLLFIMVVVVTAIFADGAKVENRHLKRRFRGFGRYSFAGHNYGSVDFGGLWTLVDISTMKMPLKDSISVSPTPEALQNTGSMET